MCLCVSVCLCVCVDLLHLEPPSFVERLEDVSCMVGSEIFMRCLLSGTLPMTFSWIKDGHELTEDEHVKMSQDMKGAILNLRNAQLLHCGKYVCEAQNKAGTHRCAAVLTVTGLSDVFVFSAASCHALPFLCSLTPGGAVCMIIWPSRVVTPVPAGTQVLRLLK